MNAKIEITVAEDIVLKGEIKRFTCKTGRVRDQFCIKLTVEAVVKIAGEKIEIVLMVQIFIDWDGRPPENPAASMRKNPTYAYLSPWKENPCVDMGSLS